MNKRITAMLVVALAGATFWSGCGTQGTTTAEQNAEQATLTEKTVSNVWGDTHIKGTPRQVVALDFYIVDSMSALGVTPAGIAGTDQTRVPAYLKDRVTSFTDIGERKQPNLELIRSISPDLIVANPERAKTIKTELQAIAPTIALRDNSFTEIMKDVDLLGDLLGKQDAAKQVHADLDQRIQTAKGKIQDNPSVLVVGSFGTDLTVWVKDSFVGSLLEQIGMNYAYGGGKSKTEGTADVAYTTLERIAEINPDDLFLYGSDVQKLEENSLFQTMKAAQTKHFYEVEQDLWSRGRGPIAAELILDQATSVVTGESSQISTVGSGN